MKSKILRALLVCTGVFILLAAVLVLHIYLVTKPKPPVATTLAMARLDVKQPITPADSTSIVNWMYTQKGVNHVMCSRTAGMVLFTYHPVANNANSITASFNSHFNKGAVRYMPSADEMAQGCPVASTSFMGRIGSMIRKIF